jgi:uncharacterized protein HemX
MKALTAMLLGLGLALSGASFAQEKKDGVQAPSAAQKRQQARMKDCNERAGERKGRERQEFMSTCLKAGAKGSKMTAQQQRMAKCNRDAGAKGIKGDARKQFMSECLKG